MGSRERSNQHYEALPLGITPYTATVEGLGIKVILETGTDPLRSKGPPDRFDLLKSAEQHGQSNNQLMETLALQLARFNDPKDSTWNIMKPSPKNLLEAAKIIIAGRKPLPFLVAYTTMAIIEHGAPEWYTNPRTFLKNYRRYTPPTEFLHRFGINGSQVDQAWEKPATLVGSVLMIWSGGYDGFDRVFMRQKFGGVYDGRWTIPGGKADSFCEVTALEEQLEEAPVTPNTWKEPLGAIDQIIVKQDKDGFELKRYLSLVWVMKTGRGHPILPPTDGDGNGNWLSIYDDCLREMIMNQEMTPIAEIAIRLWFPHIDYRIRREESSESSY